MTATVPPTPPTPPVSPGDAISGPAASGRVELAHGHVPDDPRFANDDLLPVPVERRTWTTYNFAALWIGMAHNIPSWLLASGLVALGMDWKQAVFTIALANVIVLAPMLLTGHAGPKYGRRTRGRPGGPSVSAHVASSKRPRSGRTNQDDRHIRAYAGRGGTARRAYGG
ncbi:hypothetical protein SGRI78S_01554 [Streptomyces griseus subsp. griseus]